MGIEQPHTALPSPSPTAHPQPPSTGLPTIANTKGTHKPTGTGYALPGGSSAAEGEEGKTKGFPVQLPPCLCIQGRAGRASPSPTAGRADPKGCPKRTPGMG